MSKLKFIYYLVFFFWYLLSLLPLRVLYFISDVLFISVTCPRTMYVLNAEY